jgi:rare lipoprotein A
MPRLPLALSRAVFSHPSAAVIAVALVLSNVAPAWGETLQKEPVIDAAPARVQFDAGAVIRGRLTGGGPPDEVALERRRPNGDWRIAAKQAVDEEGRVRFRLSRLRRTSAYRISYTDELTGEYSRSEVVRIRVRPRLTFRIRPGDVLRGRSVVVRGTLYPMVPGRRVLVQQRVNGAWKTMGRAAVRDGRFSHSFTARHRGYRRVRVRFSGDRTNTPAQRRRALRVYRRTLATWYGPGFYGRRTACGRRLTTETLGVAHRRLPCGTRVGLLYRGRTITVPVIDRGPFTSAEYDLTSRTARRIGFSGRTTIGVRRAP